MASNAGQLITKTALLQTLHFQLNKLYVHAKCMYVFANVNTQQLRHGIYTAEVASLSQIQHQMSKVDHKITITLLTPRPRSIHPNPKILHICRLLEYPSDLPQR